MLKKVGCFGFFLMLLGGSARAEAQTVRAEIQTVRAETLAAKLSFSEKAFTAYSSIQSNQLTRQKSLQLLGIPLALHVLEHFAGVTQNPVKNKDFIIALSCALAQHIVPLIKDKKIHVALKKGLKNFVMSGQSITFLFDAAGRFKVPSDLSKKYPELYLAPYAAKIILIMANLVVSHRQAASLIERVNKEAKRRRVKGVEWSVAEPSQNHVMLLNPWIKTFQNLVVNRGMNGLRFNVRGVIHTGIALNTVRQSKRSTKRLENLRANAGFMIGETYELAQQEIQRLERVSIPTIEIVERKTPAGSIERNDKGQQICEFKKSRQKKAWDKLLPFLENAHEPIVLQAEPIFSLCKLLLEKLIFKRAYISPQTLAKLSPQLRQEVLDLNEQERVSAAIRLTDFKSNLLWLVLTNPKRAEKPTISSEHVSPASLSASSMSPSFTDL